MTCKSHSPYVLYNGEFTGRLNQQGQFDTCFLKVEERGKYGMVVKIISIVQDSGYFACAFQFHHITLTLCMLIYKNLCNIDDIHHHCPHHNNNHNSITTVIVIILLLFYSVNKFNSACLFIGCLLAL